jgi:hypothetical protein
LTILSISLNLIELFLKFSDFDDFCFPCLVTGREGVRVVDDAKNVRLDILLDDVCFFCIVDEVGSSEHFFNSSDKFFDSEAILSKRFDLFSGTALEVGVAEPFIQFGEEVGPCSEVWFVWVCKGEVKESISEFESLSRFHVLKYTQDFVLIVIDFIGKDFYFAFADP